MVDLPLSFAFDLFLLEHAKKLPKWWLEGAVKGVQVLDVSFRITMCVEKGLGNEYGCSICGADIKQYFDHLDPLAAARYLITWI